MPINWDDIIRLHVHITWKWMGMGDIIAFIAQANLQWKEQFAESVALQALPYENKFSDGLKSELSVTISCKYIMVHNSLW